MELVLEEFINTHLIKGMVPYYIYNIIVDNIEVGRVIYRVGNDNECYFDGHIGYSVYDEYQGNNYAYKACLLLKDIIDKDYVYISCAPHNIASKKTIEKLGADLIEKTYIPSSLKKFYSEDEYEKLIYKWRIR